MSRIKEVKEDVVDKVREKVQRLEEEGDLNLPPNYAVGNALKQAFLKLQETEDSNGKPVVKSCSKTSLYNALLDTVVQGLNPGKDQVYYIAYGSTVTAQKSVFGNIALAERAANVEEVHANVIYEDDDVEIKTERGRQEVVSHGQDFGNMDNDQIAGVYAVVIFEDSRPDKYEIMTLDELKNAWKMGKVYRKDGDNPHNNFTKEMAKKTVINRALKPLIKASNDDHLFAAANRPAIERAKHEKDEGEKNSEVIDLKAEEVK